MLKTSVGGRRENVISNSKLFDPSQTLEPWMFDHIKKEFIRNCDEAVDGIVDIFLFIDDFDTFVNET